MLLVGATGIYGMKKMDAAANNMYAKQATPLGDLLTATDYFQRLRVQVRNAIIYTGNAEKLATVENDMNDRISNFEKAMQSYKQSLASEKGRQLYAAITDDYYNTFKPGILQVLEDAKKGELQEVLLEEMAATTLAANQIAIDLQDLGDARLGVMQATDEANNKLGDILLIIIIFVLLIAAVVSIILANYISKLISKPMELLTSFMKKAGETGDITLNSSDLEYIKYFAQNKDEVGECIASTAVFINHLSKLESTLKSISDGDLTADLQLLSEKDSMGNSVHKVISNLNSMFMEIKHAASQVALGASQISNGAQTLSSSSTQQAATMQQLTSSISEVSQKTKETAELASNAAKLANNIMQNAETSNQQMKHMIEAVDDINQANRSISQVIKVIDDIAFQTNILALNAAVEAARAGSHGKGFAVVAEEVRNLAAKSAESAQNTGSLIANSMQKAELGTKIAADTASSLGVIVTEITESNKINSKMAQFSEEQSNAIVQIDTAIVGVTQAVSQNSATAEESAASSEEMNSQANVLDELIRRFKLTDNKAFV